MQWRATSFGHVMVLRPGDELIDSLKQLADERNVQAAMISGLGAVNHVELGYYRPAERRYQRQVFDEELEVLGITGTLSLQDGAPHPHVHGIFGRPDFSTIGGHVFRAICSVTLEVGIVAAGVAIVRGPVDYSDLQLMKPEATA